MEMGSLEERVTELEKALSAADRKINMLTNTIIEMLNSLKGLAESSHCKENHCGQLLRDLQSKMN
jgi:hypothetical protein